METLKRKELIDAWSYGKPITFNKKEYSVNKMNYGVFFLTPFGMLFNEGDNAKLSAIWLKENSNEKNTYVPDEFMNKTNIFSLTYTSK